MSRAVRFHQVDVFTRERFRGNPAGVVPDAAGLTDAQMQAIARELNNPETAFVVDAAPDGTIVEIRFFSPSVEVPLCGHASVAVHWVRARENGGPTGVVRQRSPGGAWEVEVEEADGDFRVWLLQAPVRFRKPLGPADRAGLLGALGLRPSELDVRFPILPVDTGHAKIMVGVASADLLDGIEPDMRDLAVFQRRTGWDGVQVFTLEARDPGVAVESRMFAPALGIPEDPVTGSGQGPLGALLVRHGLVPGWEEGRVETELVSLQGRAMGRPGTARLRVECREGRPERVRVGGDAVEVFRGEIEI